jgi:hypothetical protein
VIDRAYRAHELYENCIEILGSKALRKKTNRKAKA